MLPVSPSQPTFNPRASARKRRGTKVRPATVTGTSTRPRIASHAAMALPHEKPWVIRIAATLWHIRRLEPCAPRPRGRRPLLGLGHATGDFQPPIPRLAVQAGNPQPRRCATGIAIQVEVDALPLLPGPPRQVLPERQPAEMMLQPEPCSPQAERQQPASKVGPVARVSPPPVFPPGTYHRRRFPVICGCLPPRPAYRFRPG